MKKLLLLPFFILLINCTSDQQKHYLQSKSNFENELKQYFNVAPDSLIVITGKKGTKITFNPEDLVSILYPNINDTLQVELIELVSKQDLLLANAQTKSEDKWLISGGAYKIDILHKGEPLSLKENKSIKVQFPLITDENDMQLFYGERNRDGNMNWNKTKTILEEKKYFTIYYNESDSIDSTETVKYNYQDEAYETIMVIDTLGKLSLSEFNRAYPKLILCLLKRIPYEA